MDETGKGRIDLSGSLQKTARAGLIDPKVFLPPGCPDRPGDVVYRVCFGDGFPQRGGIIQVADHEPNGLLLERVSVTRISNETRNRVSPAQQSVDKIAAYETGGTGYKDGLL